MELQLKQREMELKEQQLAMQAEAIVGSVEVERAKKQLRLTQIMGHQLEQQRAILAAEKTQLDTRPADLQHANRGKWIKMSTPKRREYTYNHTSMSVVLATSVPVTLEYNSDPFAKGSMRFAYHGLLGRERVVLKKFIFCQGTNFTIKYCNSNNKTGPEMDLQEAEQMVVIHKVAEFYAKQFNDKRPPSTSKIEVCQISIVQSEGIVWMVEPLLSGTYKKWNNNDEYPYVKGQSA